MMLLEASVSVYKLSSEEQIKVNVLDSDFPRRRMCVWKIPSADQLLTCFLLKDRVSKLRFLIPEFLSNYHSRSYSSVETRPSKPEIDIVSFLKLIIDGMYPRYLMFRPVLDSSLITLYCTVMLYSWHTSRSNSQKGLVPIQHLRYVRRR